MIVEMDRILKGMEYWNKREDQLKEAFRDDMTDKSHLEDKLKYMESLRDTYKYQVLSGTEKSRMRSLKSQIDKLERRLYPHRLERLLKRLLRTVSKIIPNTWAQFRASSGNTNQNVSAIQKPEPSSLRQQLDGHHDRHMQNNQLQNKNGIVEPLNNDRKNDLLMVKEYKRWLSEKNTLQQPKTIKHRLR
jgi:hypothetical protein